MKRKGGPHRFRVTLRCVFVFLLFPLIGILGCDDNGGGGIVGERPALVTKNKLNVEILDATVGPDRRPSVTFRLTDEDGNPIGRDGVRIRFIIARLDEGKSQYFDYITRVQTSPAGSSAVQADFEESGTYEDLGDGLFTYTFDTVLPENYDRNATHTVGIFADKTVGAQTFVANATFDFVPSGGEVRVIWDKVRTETCNSCHDPLAAHGGFRRDVKLCVLCHSEEIVDPDTGEIVEHVDPDTGNSIGFEVMIHKIHMGAELPSVRNGVPYQIVGFRQMVFDFSTVEFPQDIRNCTKCHSGATQSDSFKTNLSRAACGSCHDDVNFVSGANHGGGIQLDDNNCSSCHLPSTGREFDLSVVGSHTIPLKSAQAPGVNFEIVSIESAETGDTRVRRGEHPKVTFRITDNTGQIIPPSEMNFLRLTLALPTLEYHGQDYNGDGIVTSGDPTSPWTPGGENYIQEDPREEAQGPDASGNFTYVFKAMIPNVSGSGAIGIEGFRCTTIQGANQRRGGINCDGTRDLNGNGVEDVGEVFNQIREAGRAVVRYFPITDAEPTPRRRVVDDERCSTCHGVFSKDFSVHGNIRNNTEYCALCHNPSHDTLSRQLPPVGQVALTNSLDYKNFIHKIHTGEDLTKKPYLLYAPPGGAFPNQFERATDFSEVRFPGDRRNCETCHLPDTYILDPGRGVLGANVLPSTTHEFIRGETTKTVRRTFFTSPVISVCTSCHDSLGVSPSGDALTGENHIGGAQPESACINCHIAGEPLGVEEVHIPPLPPEERIIRPQ
ncbi:MAG: cytochrome c [Deltaproteobacteria bacterium]|nr:MAG: cytochrome c [Deltaproteobacteria bacterium]